MEDFGHWTLLCESQEDFYGFIYIITNTTNKRKYIGKKQCKTIVKYPPLKGKKNKRHIQKETDWRSYSGSSDWLNYFLSLRKNSISLRYGESRSLQSGIDRFQQDF